MASINAFMAEDHRRCDELFAEAEQAVDRGDWELAAMRAREFLRAMEEHFRMEENVLFPAFEEATGMTQGPTQVMRQEHEQMRSLFRELEEAVQSASSDDYLGSAETLLIMMQQHNMKEEGVLYPMSDRQLGPRSDSVLGDMRAATQ